MPQKKRDTGERYAEVAIALPLDKTFHYAVPAHLHALCKIGKRVLVPFGKRTITGYVLDHSSPLPADIKNIDIKEILDVIDDAPLFDKRMLRLFRWTANYYLAPLGEVIKAALPPGINWEGYYHVSLTTKGKEAPGKVSGKKIPHVKLLRAIDPNKGNPLKQLLKKYLNIQIK